MNKYVSKTSTLLFILILQMRRLGLRVLLHHTARCVQSVSCEQHAADNTNACSPTQFTLKIMRGF